jgi:uncharacterized protein YggE
MLSLNNNAKCLIFSVLVVLCTNLYGQNDKQNRFIEVTGSAESNVEPDEIMLCIGIEEYLNEELNQNTQFRNYQKKVSITEIEASLFSELRKIGINKDQIKTKDLGNQWKYPQYGKDFLLSKQFEITIDDFKMMDKLVRNVNTKGVSSITIQELRNKNIADFKNKLKTEAVKSAKDKATTILQSIGKKLGDVISIIELMDDGNIAYSNENNTANYGSITQGQSAVNFKKIQLKYQIKAKFEIE